MGKVTSEISISLDGFITGPRPLLELVDVGEPEVGHEGH